MIVDTAEAKCAIGVLSMLERGSSRYNLMFRMTKVSHTTLQAVLRDLVNGRFILKNELDYGITEKGRRLFETLKSLSSLTSKTVTD